MRSRMICGVILCVASVGFAKDLKAYQAGKLVQMESIPCGTDEVSGGDSGHGKSRQLLCQEYVLQSDRVTYHIRPRDVKHPVLLPLSERAEFRSEKDRMVLRVADLDGKDREFTVVSMSPRSESDSADASTPRLNHLQ
jgi:hypothetical protein